MSSLVALILFGTPTAPTPSVRELILEAAPGITLYANGYLEGFIAERTEKFPLPVFV